MIKYVLQKTKWATISCDWVQHKLDYTSAATLALLIMAYNQNLRSVCGIFQSTQYLLDGR